MKISSSLVTTLVFAVSSALPVRADFGNGGFEATNFLGWTIEYGTFAGSAWSWAAILPVAHPVPIVIHAGSPLAAGQTLDVDPYCDNHMARINDLHGNFHATRLRQETLLTSTTAQCSTLSVTWGAMLEDGSHTLGGQPEFTIEVRIAGASASLTRVDANDALAFGSGWTLIPPNVWYKSATTEVSISGQTAGDLVEVILTAHDCQFGGHGGMAFLDCVKLWPCPSTDAFCEGTGTGSATPCPCSNFGLIGRGCGNSVDPNGARLTATGSWSLSNDTVVLDASNMTTSPALFIQGTTRRNGGAGSVFGDGLLCVGGTIVRLGVEFSVGGSSQYPTAADPSLSAHVMAPGTRTYQVWYRDSANFCTA